MPPVLGPASPSPTRLKSWAGARATARVPSQTAKTDTSGPVIPSSMTTVRPASPNAAPDSFAPHVGLGLGEVSVTSTPLPAARPSVFTTQGGARVRRKARPGLDLGEGAVAGGGHAGGRQQLLHVRLGALDLGAVGPRAEHQLALGAQPVGQPVHQRGLRPDHEQVGLELLGRGGHRPGDARVPRGDHDLGRPRQDVGQAASRPPPPTTQTLTGPQRVAVTAGAGRTGRGRGRRRGGGWARRPAPRGRRRSPGPGRGAVQARWPRSAPPPSRGAPRTPGVRVEHRLVVGQVLVAAPSTS